MTNQIDILDEVKQNFIDSSYDVNTNRAFPNVKDGLKPGQRACLWEMYTKGYTSNKPHVKSAKIDGGVAALWWPHGTTAIYETFARMSQPFTNNVPEVDFHGANGNIILGGDALAADRYTEARLSKIVEEGMLKGIDKNNVPMLWNFSEDEQWPQVLPAVFPRLLVNGCQGIGVSVANVFLPHSFTETANLILKYLKENILDEEEYYPDFPTGGTIINQDELATINKTGKGRVILEANYTINNNEIVFYEMPYQVYIEPVIETIKEKIEDGAIEGINDVFNKSDKKRIALVIECQKGYRPEQIVEQLFQNTPLRSQYNANQNGIISKTPVLLNLQQIVDCYIEHNLECIQKEFQFDLDKTNARIEILEGLIAALANIDDIVNIIRKSDSPTEAKNTLMDKYSFTENQAKSILDMKLARLTKLDGVKLNDELQEKQEYAAKCAEIVGFEDSRKQVLIERLTELRDKFGDKRCTKVIQKTITKKVKNGSGTKQSEPVEDVVITYNPIGYLQRIPISSYRKSNFKGFKCTTEDLVLLFSNKGRFFRISTKDIKSCGVKDKGTAIGAIIKLQSGEKIINVFSSILNEKHPYLTFVLNNGIIKKVSKYCYFSNNKSLAGLKALKLKDRDYVVSVLETNGDILRLETKDKYEIYLELNKIRESQKNSYGIKGIKLSTNDKVVTVETFEKNDKNIITKVQLPNGKGKKMVKK